MPTDTLPEGLLPLMLLIEVEGRRRRAQPEGACRRAGLRLTIAIGLTRERGVTGIVWEAGGAAVGLLSIAAHAFAQQIGSCSKAEGQ